MPAMTPRHPAWIAPTISPRASIIRIGTQSALATASRIPGSAVTIPSPSGFARNVLARDDANRLAVHLMASRDGRVADDLAQPPPVLIDMRGIVADPVCEVETLVRSRY